MPSYVAMLRGINVSGSKPVKMEALRASFEALGFKNVRTYVQSGNVVFEAKERAPARLGPKIVARIKRDFGFDVPVLMLSARELARIVEENPFVRQRGVDLTKLHVTFLASAPAAAGLKKMEGVSSGRDAFQCLGTSIYLLCPDGYGNSKLSNNAFERALAAAATTRNWKTVTALATLAAGESRESA
ncbi:MAG TPA: DUF1697 domain-containing protein [Polyangia bacterium]|nr:DUF1697 domain-containing protein [Polyangia bacterium]